MSLDTGIKILQYKISFVIWTKWCLIEVIFLLNTTDLDILERLIKTTK